MTAPQAHNVSQMDFQETAYADASWEIVGEKPQEARFAPIELQVIHTDNFTADPMFADYGGMGQKGGVTRRHISSIEEEQSLREEAALKEMEETTIRISPDEIEQMKADAYAKGHADAKSQLEPAHQRKLKEIESRIETLLNDVVQQIQGQTEKIEKDALELAVAISRKLVGHAVEVNPEYILPLIKEGLSVAGGAVIQRIRISPDDFEFINIVGLTTSVRKEGDSWKFEPDPTVRSGCILDTSGGQIDFDLDAAFERISDTVLRVIHEK